MILFRYYSNCVTYLYCTYYVLINSVIIIHKISFDIDSLFTNILLHETIWICRKKLFTDPGVSTVYGFTVQLFETLLEHAVFNSFFFFNDNCYQQIEGMGMGSPLSPTFAYVSMSPTGLLTVTQNLNPCITFAISTTPFYYLKKNSTPIASSPT